MGAGVDGRFARQVEGLAVVTDLVEKAGCHVFLVHPDLHPELPHPFICAMPDLIFEPEEMTYDPSDVTFNEHTGRYVIWHGGVVVRRNVSAGFAARIIIDEYLLGEDGFG
jgi:hypothetical protein